MTPAIDIRFLYYFFFFFFWEKEFNSGVFFCAVSGVYLAETINKFLGSNWKKFAGQNYFDPRGLFLSVLWSGPLLLIAIIILVSDQSYLYICFIFHMPGTRPLLYYFQTLNLPLILQLNTLFSLCRLLIKWKRAELRHRALLARNKQD